MSETKSTASGTIVSADQAEQERRGLMLVLSSPSGAGKSTLARMLLEREDNLELSISATTRARRSTEVDGVHYHFVDNERFSEMAESGDLLEWATVHGNSYGTPRGPVEATIESGRDILFDIDIQGTFQLYEKMRDDVVSIFILPPSISEMKSRLRGRAEDTEEVILKRLKTAVGEMRHWSRYDYVVVNEDLERAYENVRAILKAERLKQKRSGAVGKLMDGMVDDLQDELK
ncbi:guanylate kinase [Roseibium algae]|uniref:Guanylate kinase n=1 Tax=Roseibium algae TaxID=3123038 RepID=A0ABU8TME7_9HYPH